jgi:CheY-like chemotaxis protein
MTPFPIVILYVEDEPRSRKVMQMIVSEIDIAYLLIFDDSTNFLARVDALNPMPTLVFLDIHMEPYNGFEMLAMLRQLPKYDTVPIVAMTASVMNEEIEQLRAAGFNGCIGKPIDIDTFPDAIQRILNGEVLWRIVN